MAGSIGEDLSTFNVPSVGDSETDASADVSAILVEMKARLDDKVTPSEIDINADLDYSSNSLTTVASMQFVTQGSDAGEERLYTKNDGTFDELWFENSNGDVCQITKSGAVNVSATGTIEGAGYGSGGVAVNWNAAGPNYQLKGGSGADDYPNVPINEAHLRAGSAHAVTLAAAAAMSSDYTVTFPSASGSAGLVSQDGSGNLAFADTVTANLTWGGTHDFEDWSNIKYNDRDREFPPAASYVQNTGTVSTVTNSTAITINNGATALIVLDGIEAGEQIDSVSIRYLDGSSGGSPPNFILRRDTDGTPTAASDAGAFDQGGAAATVTVSGTGSNTYDGKGGFFLYIDNNPPSSGTLTIYSVVVTTSKA